MARLGWKSPENKAETGDWEEIWKEAERGAATKDVKRNVSFNFFNCNDLKAGKRKRSRKRRSIGRLLQLTSSSSACGEPATTTVGLFSGR